MEKHPLHVHSNPINRRQLLGRGAALMGGALAGAVFQPRVASGQEMPMVARNLHPPVVQVKGGKLRGFVNGRTYTFLGVPYAEADRFELPKPVAPWDDVKSAQAWGPICPIPAMTEPGSDEFVFPHRYWLQNEHCQFLNVWTQSLDPGAKRPVMVWMHGGGFTNGSSMESYAYDGKNLSEFGDVVTVSMNHRLNIIGTLDLSAYGSEYENSRYTGTADLVTALQWVQDNIEAFGGDPDNVTIFGQSGGGSKVCRMMVTPAAEGLFHRVVAQSGGSFNPDSDPAEDIRIQQMIAAATLNNLNLNGNQIDELKAVPYADLLAAGDDALEQVANETGQRARWGPIADDKYVMREIRDWARGIPFMAGMAFSEFGGNLQSGDDKNAWSEREINERLTAAYGDKTDEIVTEFQKAFPSKKAQDVLYYAASSRPGMRQKLQYKLENGSTPVYSYIFAYEYPVNGGITAFHCSEIAFVFHNLSEPHVRLATGGTPEAFELQDKVSRAWINFAHTGNPSQPGLEFKPYTVQNPQTMVFDTLSECRALGDDELVSLMPAQSRG